MFQNQPFINPLHKTEVFELFTKFTAKSLLESLFYKVAVLRACNFIKENSNTGAFP